MESFFWKIDLRTPNILLQKCGPTIYNYWKLAIPFYDARKNNINLRWGKNVPAEKSTFTNLCLDHFLTIFSHLLKFFWFFQVLKFFFLIFLSSVLTDLVRQRCPTHSPLASCGELKCKCGEWFWFWILKKIE